MPAPPTRCSSNVRSSATALRTSTAAAATSGPIPSPGRRTILGISCRTLQIQRNRAWTLPRGLAGGDLAGLLEREIDVVQPVQQPVAAVLVELEGTRAGGEAPLAVLEVDLGLPRVHQRLVRLLCERGRQQADLRAVREEDV